MIFFIGSNPAQSSNSTIPFENCRSGEVLKEWIALLGIKEYTLLNICDYPTPNNRLLTKAEIKEALPALKEKIASAKIIVALGRTALQTLAPMTSERKDLRVFYLPHPSGKNRLLNNKEFVKNLLAEIKIQIEDLAKRV